jgi:hypothetical protein
MYLAEKKLAGLCPTDELFVHHGLNNEAHIYRCGALTQPLELSKSALFGGYPSESMLGNANYHPTQCRDVQFLLPHPRMRSTS